MPSKLIASLQLVTKIKKTISSQGKVSRTKGKKGGWVNVGLVPDAVFRVWVPERLIGILLPNNQRQHRTLHIQKDVLPYALC